MWKQVVQVARNVLTLTTRVERHDNDIKALQQDLKDLRAQLDRMRSDATSLAHLTEQLIGEMQHDREPTAVQQRDLVLELKNRLLRIEGAARSAQSDTPHLTP